MISDDSDDFDDDDFNDNNFDNNQNMMYFMYLDVDINDWEIICYRNLFISCYILSIDDLLFNYRNIVVLSFSETSVSFSETSKFENRFIIVIRLKPLQFCNVIRSLSYGVER